jgi:hypothetical protein
MKKAAAPKAAPKEASKSASPRKSSKDGSQDMFASQEAVEEQRQSSQMSQTPSSSSFPEPGGKPGGSNNNPFESYQEVVQRLNQQKRQQQTQTQQKVSTPSPRKTSSVRAKWPPLPLPPFLFGDFSIFFVLCFCRGYRALNLPQHLPRYVTNNFLAAFVFESLTLSRSARVHGSPHRRLRRIGLFQVHHQDRIRRRKARRNSPKWSWISINSNRSTTTQPP